MDYVLLFISVALVNNFVLVQFLGVCPFMGVSKNIGSAVGMGVAVVFVTTVAAAICFMVNRFILSPLDMDYLYLIVFIMVIAVVVQGMEIFIKKASPPLYAALGIYLPLITTNCAIVAVVLNIRNSGDGFMASMVGAFGAAVGFMLVIVIFAGIRERIERCDVPKSFKGFPISIVAAGLMSMAFLGFSSLI